MSCTIADTCGRTDRDPNLLLTISNAVHSLPPKVCIDTRYQKKLIIAGKRLYKVQSIIRPLQRVTSYEFGAYVDISETLEHLKAAARMSFVVATTKVHNHLQPGLALVPADRPSFRDIVVPGTSCNCESTSRIFGKPYGA